MSSPSIPSSTLPLPLAISETPLRRTPPSRGPYSSLQDIPSLSACYVSGGTPTPPSPSNASTIKAHNSGLLPYHSTEEEEKPYLVINKPPNVRMDAKDILTTAINSSATGRDATLMDLLVKWYFDKTLYTNDGDGAKNGYTKTFRWIHQLDSATSGILIIGLTKQFTSFASKAFESRCCKKQYLALIDGWISESAAVNEAIEKEESFMWNGVEDGFRSGVKLEIKRKRKCGMKAFDEWKRTVNKDDLKEEEVKWIEVDWNEAKKDSKCKDRFESEIDKVDDEEEMENKNVYTTIDDKPNDKEGTFYITSTCSENGANFECLLHPSALSDNEHASFYEKHYPTDSEGEGKLQYKPSLTQCTVLQQGMYNGRKVTKLLYKPHTGRRHQLRLHSVALGSWICGDGCYVPTTSSNGADDADDGNMGREKERMCLHAWKLRMEVEDWTISKGKKGKKGGGVKKVLEFESKDPFVFNTETGEFEVF